MKSIIIGAGTYGEVYASYLRQSGVEITGFLDDNIEIHGKFIGGIPILGATNLLSELKYTHHIESVYCPIGNNPIRVQFLKKAYELGYEIPNYIHPSVNLSEGVEIGKGVYILLGSNIMPFTKISDFVMISMGVNVAHHSKLKEGVFLSTGCNFGASIVAERYAYCGISSIIMTGIKEIGENCLIGAGAVVIKDVPANAVMAGVPAKILKYKQLPPPNQRLIQFQIANESLNLTYVATQQLWLFNYLNYAA